MLVVPPGIPTLRRGVELMVGCLYAIHLFIDTFRCWNLKDFLLFLVVGRGAIIGRVDGSRLEFIHFPN